MKRSKFNIIIMVLCMMHLSLFGREIMTKKANVSYDTNTNTNLHVDNRFGSITIKNTDADKISIDVLVTVEASKATKARELLEEVLIQISQDGNNIEAITELGDINMTGNKKVTIDYTILMPAYVNTNLVMKYGNVNIETIVGHFDAEIKYGSLVANDLTAYDNTYINKLDLKYAENNRINHFENIQLDMSYSKMKLGRGNNLLFESKYSDLTVDNIQIVKGEAGYCDISIKNAGEVYIGAKYSDVEVDNLNKSFESEIKYGDIDIDNLSVEFEFVKIDANYTDITVSVPDHISFIFDLNVQYGDIDIPVATTVLRDVKEGSDHSMKGYRGQPTAIGQFIIESDYGDVNIAVD